MSAKYPGVAGQDFAEHGLNRAANFIQLQSQAGRTPSSVTLGSAISANQTLTTVYIGPRKFHTVEITGTFTATVTIYGAVPGSTNFFALTPQVLSGTASGTGITAPGLYTFEGTLDRMYAAVSSLTAGSVENIRLVSVTA